MEMIALGMLIPFAIAGLASARGPTAGRFVASQLATVIAVQLALALSFQEATPFYADAAALLAVVAVVAGVLFARFLERWL